MLLRQPPSSKLKVLNLHDNRHGGHDGHYVYVQLHGHDRGYDPRGLRDHDRDVARFAGTSKRRHARQLHRSELLKTPPVIK